MRKPFRNIASPTAELFRVGNVAWISSFAALAFAFVPAAHAAGSCAAITQAVSDHGSYIHHYRDPAQPGLDLYERFVSSSSQCGGGYLKMSMPVSSLIDCELPSCVKVTGDANY
jgi:hypothetical protein